MNLPEILKIHSNDSEDLVLQMRVAGSTFVDESQDILMALRGIPRDKLMLTFKRERDNEHDEFAVRVSIKVEGYDRSRFIGYIPQKYSELVSYVIENRDKYRLLVTSPVLCGGVEGKENVGVFFDLRIQRKVDEDGKE